MNGLLRAAAKKAALEASGTAGGDSADEDASEERDDEVAQSGTGAPPPLRRSRGFTRYWELGMLRRSRGTVQSDRLRCPAALLAGSKLIAVIPKLGWWDERDDTVEESMRFSLITACPPFCHPSSFAPPPSSSARTSS